MTVRRKSEVNIPTSTTSNTRIAVFIDFDNVEIGVKNTIGGQFDIGLILEAIKERGEIVTKVAYSDWKRAGDYSRVLTQHAIHGPAEHDAGRRQERRGHHDGARRP